MGKQQFRERVYGTRRRVLSFMQRGCHAKAKDEGRFE